MGTSRPSAPPGDGTTLRIYLSEVVISALQPMDRREGGETILLLDGDRLVRKTVRDTLEHHGYHVLEADSGPEALRLCHEFSGVIHLVLADMIMQGMSGPEAVRRIRAERPDISVLFMSASFLGDEAAKDARMGPNCAFIEKPFDERELATMLRRSLDLVR